MLFFLSMCVFVFHNLSSLLFDVFVCNDTIYFALLFMSLFACLSFQLGDTALMKAADRGFVEMVEWLLNNGATVNDKRHSVSNIVFILSIYSSQ